MVDGGTIENNQTITPQAKIKRGFTQPNLPKNFLQILADQIRRDLRKGSRSKNDNKGFLTSPDSSKKDLKVLPCFCEDLTASVKSGALESYLTAKLEILKQRSILFICLSGTIKQKIFGQKMKGSGSGF